MRGVRGIGLVVVSVCLLVAAGCGASDSGAQDVAGGQLTAPYLGQDPPGSEPQVFAPGIVSDPQFMEWCGTFSPDGSEYYFNRFVDDSLSKLFVTRFADGGWTSPEPCGFTGDYSAAEPHLTLDNKRLYFNWNRDGKALSDPTKMPEYYFVERTTDGWSEPRDAGQGMFLSSALDGAIYTTDMSDRVATHKTYLARVETETGVFENYQRLAIEPGLGIQAHPGIAPDGSYILFDIDGGSHMFVSFRQDDGTWGTAIDLTKHGLDPLAGGGYVSPDGKYLFFALKDDIWWVDASFIEDLRPN